MSRRSHKPLIRSVLSTVPRDKTKGQDYHRGAMFVEGIPISTKTAFKAACALRSVAMRDVLIKLMRDYVAGTR